MTTISTPQGPYTLSVTNGDNPLEITGTGSVAATGAGNDAIDGDASADWQITIDSGGTVSSTSGYGINLTGEGTISNSGSISGSGGLRVEQDGSVTNTGTISATGLQASADVPPLAAISGIYVKGTGGVISVNNAGVVTAADGSALGLIGGYGIGLGASGTVVNSGQVTGSEDGVIVTAGVGTIENSGSVVATRDDGVSLFGGGTVTNDVKGSISALATIPGETPAGVFITGGLGTITNSGDIAGSYYGALLAAGGTITNNALATISGQNSGVYVSTGGTVSNGGTISGGVGADLELGGSVTNNKSGTISGVAYGIYIANANGTVINSGQITGTTSSGVLLKAGGTVQNKSGGAIDGVTAGVDLSNGGSITNDGSIAANGKSGTGAYLELGGTVTNDSTGKITAESGVFGQGTVINSGHITGTISAGVALAAGGTVQNNSGGAIDGQTAGVTLSNGGSITNAGSIGASATGAAGADLMQGGKVTNNSGGAITGAYGVFVTGNLGTVINSGQITGTTSGVALAAGGTVQNNSGGAINGGSGSAGVGADLELGGSVTNNSGGTITGGAYGVFVAGGVAGAAGTVTNAGTISGKTYAVDFSTINSANRLVDEPGAVFIGAVNGGGGVLELASGAGSISGVGGASPAFAGFQTLAVDTGANWTLNSANTIATVTNNGALDIVGSLDVTTAIDPNSTGVFDLSAGGTLEVAQALGAQAAIDFLGASELLIDNAALFGTGVGTASYQGAQLEDFGAGDWVDLRNFSGAGATWRYNATSGLLQISNGASQNATFDFQNSTLSGGTFQIGTDGSSGILINLSKNVAAPAATISANLDSYEAKLPSSITVTDSLPLTATAGQITSDAGALALTSNANGTPYQLAVTDTAAGITTGLDGLNGAHIASIAISDNKAIGVDVAQLNTDSAAIGRLANQNGNPYQLAVTDTAAGITTGLDGLNGAHIASIAISDNKAIGVDVAQLNTDSAAIGKLANQNGNPYQLAVTDTAAAITTGLDGLNGAHIASIAISDNKAIGVDVAQLNTDSAAIGKLANQNGNPYQLAVTDTAAAITTGLDGLNGAHIASIAISDNKAIGVDVAQLNTDSAAIGKLANQNGNPYQLAVTDTAAAITTGLDGLNGAHIASIAISDNKAIGVDVAQLNTDSAAIGKLANQNYQLAVTDTAAAITTGLDELNGAHIASIAISDNKAIGVDVAQLNTDSAAIGKLANQNGNPYQLAVTDTAAAITTGLDGLNGAHIASIAISDNKAIGVDVAQLNTDSAAIGKLANHNGNPYQLAVTDTAANVSAAFDTLNNDSHVTSIALTDSQTPLTLTTLQAANDTRALGEITTPYTITISNTGASVAATAAFVSAQLDSYEASLPASITITDGKAVTVSVSQIALDATALSLTTNEKGSPYTLVVEDSAASVSAAFDPLNSNSHVTSIVLTDGGTPALTLSAAQALGDTAALGDITLAYKITISDTAANVAKNLDALNGDSKVTSIALTDSGTPALTLSAAQALGNTTALGDITTPYTITISDTAADVAKNLDALNTDTHVKSIAVTDSGTPALTLSTAQALGDTTALGDITTPYTIAISDTAADVATNLDALNGDSKVTSIVPTDSGTPALTLSAAQALGDTTALGDITTPYAITISDTAANVAAHLDALNGDSQVSSIALTNGGTPALTLRVAQALGDTTALGDITTPYTITISDTAADVAANLNALDADTHVKSIALTDGGTPALTLTSAQCAYDTKALGDITTPYTITISDTAADLAANLDALNANTHVRSIALTDSGTPALTLTVAQALGDTTTLGDITTPYTITISDTAADVAANLNALDGDSQVTSIVLTDAGGPTLTLTSAQCANDTKALNEISTPYTITISNGATALLQVGNHYELAAVSAGTGPLLRLNGAAVTVGQFPAGWTPVEAIETGFGYEVAFVAPTSTPGQSQYVVWNVDSNGNYISNATGVLLGTSAELEAVEADFGEIFPGGGPLATKTRIAANVTTTLAQVGNLFELNPTSGGMGPFLELNGSPVTAGQFPAGWKPVGAKQTGDGYEVAFSAPTSTPGQNQYVVWNTDSKGDYTSAATGILSGTSPTLEAVEANFDETSPGEAFPGAGPPASTTTIVTNGTTALAQVGDLFELNPAGGGTGPLIELNGSMVTAGQFPLGWTPVGAVQTANGYQVAWSVLGANEYVVWNTDSNGDYTSAATGILSGTSPQLEAIEAAFGEQFLGAGPPASTTTIATNGITTLAQVGNYYELEAVSGGTGPLIELKGSAVTAGQFPAGWTPVGAVMTATGYEVAWSVLGANEYAVWNTDSDGGYTSAAMGNVSGQSFALEDLNPLFGENLNSAPSLSQQLYTIPTAGNTLDLSLQTENATINLGANTAFSRSAGGLSGSDPTISGSPFKITLGGDADIVEYALAPASGIEEVTGFNTSIDELNIALGGAPDTVLLFHDTTVGGVTGVSIFSSADPSHGLVLFGETAAALHTNFIGEHALIT